MKFDRIVANMNRGDTEIVLAVVIRDHLTCECVDRRDIEAHADHIAKEVADLLQYDPRDDDLSDFVLKEGPYAKDKED